MAVQQRKRVKPIVVAAANVDYNENLPAAMYRVVNMKFSGTITASGAGTNAGDGPFGLVGRIEARRGGDLLIGLHGPDWRHLSAFLEGGYPEILPASIATATPFLAQGQLRLDRLIPFGGIDGTANDVTFTGRTRGFTNLGTTVTALSAGSLKFAGETGTFPNGRDCMEPRISSNFIDCSAASADLSTRRQIANDVEVCAAIMLRTFDSSLELSDPNTFRSDGMVREIRVDLERDGQSIEVGRWTWGEAKQVTQQVWGINAASGQVQTGVVLLPIVDPKGPGGRLRLTKGDALVVRVDTAATVEPEFTALTAAAGDGTFVTFCNFTPRGPGVDHLKRRIAAGQR